MYAPETESCLVINYIEYIYIFSVLVVIGPHGGRMVSRAAIIVVCRVAVELLTKLYCSVDLTVCAQLHIQAIYLHNYCLYWAYMYTTQPLISYLVGGYYTLAIVYIYILAVAVCECKLRILYVQSHRAREHRCIAADIWRVYGEWMRYDNIMCVCSFFHFFFCICRCCICWAGDLQSDVTWHRRCCSTKAGYMSKYMQCTPVRVNKCVGSGNPIASHHNRRVTRWLETIMQQN